MTPPIELLACPACRSALLRAGEGRFCCPTPDCPIGKPEFPSISGQPVLIDFAASVVALQDVTNLSATAQDQRAQLGGSAAYRIYKRLTPGNRVAAQNAARLLQALGQRRDPLLLVIGGGTRGAGADALWDAQNLRRLAFDIYASANTNFVADAHRIPLRDGAVDAVWIQAVLEHVLEPAQVVQEIERVLAADGLVYAETPFLQHVHEGAYDFTRFTHSGHRWLFRGFEEIASGPVGAAGASMVWSVRHLIQAATGSRTLGRATAVAFGWLGALDRLGSPRAQLDSACGLYFLGRKSGQRLQPRDMAAYYKTEARP